MGRILMTTGKVRRGVTAVLSFLVMAACNLGYLTEPSGGTTYQSVWINATWNGGRTGSPLSSRTYGPGSFTGSYCPSSSLILENHSSRYQDVFSNSPSVLVFKNTCTGSANLLVCVTAGSGGNFSEFPVCNVDPRTTPLSRLASVDMGPNGSGLQSTTWRETGVNLDLNIFYCGAGDAFTAGVISGANPTDCLQ
jgi:hypothetical protein